MQRSTSPTIDLVPENLFIDSVARGVCNSLEVAVKKIPRQLLPIEDDITKLLTQLDHENVLKIFAVDDDGTRFSPSGSKTGNFFVPGGMYRYISFSIKSHALP
jgi:hypothetical protein